MQRLDRRAVVLGVAAAAAAWIVLRALPGTAGGEGTPMAVLFSGLVVGAIHALAAAGLVLVYRTLGVVNFAHTAIGAAGAELTFQLVTRTEVPFALAFVLGTALSAALGVVFAVVVARRFQDAPMTLTVATVAVAGLSVITVEAVSRLPFFAGPITPQEAVGAATVRSDLPFPGFRFGVGDFPVPFGFAEVFAIEVALLVLLLLHGFLTTTRLGIAVRALASNRERVVALGASPTTLAATVWGLAAVLGGVGAVLFGTVTTPGAARGVAPALLLPALAAAALARFRSITIAAGASVALGVLVAAVTHSLPRDRALVDLVFLGVVLVGLLLTRAATHRGRRAGRRWEWQRETRPVPEALAGLPVVRRVRVALKVLVAVAASVYPFVVDVSEIRLGGTIAIVGMVATSIVVLTGWTGQVSLGQWAFAAVGAVVSAWIAGTVGLGFWVSAPFAMAAGAGAAALVGVPALRLQGPFLAVATLALGLAVPKVLFDDRYMGWLLPDEIDRPTLLFVDFADERSMYFLSLGCLLAVVAIARSVRRGALGRAMLATRDDPEGAEALGVRVVRSRICAFAVSGAVAGLAGAVFAHQQLALSADAFSAQRSVDTFLLTVIGGVGSLAGAAAGSLGWNVVEHLWSDHALVGFVQPFLALTVLVLFPGGLVAAVVRGRDAALGLVARRHGVDVTQLSRVAAVGDPLPQFAARSASAGMAALPASTSYRLGGSRLTRSPGSGRPEPGRDEASPVSQHDGEPEARSAQASIARSAAGLLPVGLVALLGFVLGVNAQILGLATLDVARDLGFTLDGILKFAGATATASLLLSVAVAHRADRSRRVTIVGLALIAAGMAGACASLAGSPLTLGAAVVAADVLLVVALVPTASLLADWYPPEVRGRAFAVAGLGHVLGGALAFFVAGEVIDAVGWRSAYVGMFLPVTGVGALILVRLREPVRGWWERRAMGSPEDVAAEEDDPVSFGEAWRTVWSVRMLRRMVVSEAFVSAGTVLYGTLLVLLLVEEYRYDAGDLGRLFGVAALFALPATVVGGRLVDRFNRTHPSRTLGVFALFSAVAAFGTLAAPARPPAWVLSLGTGVFLFGAALLGPALASVYAAVSPPHVRTVGTSVKQLARLPGVLLLLPMASVVVAEYGIEWALVVPFPLLLCGAVLLLGTAPLYELDVRGARAASVAAIRWRESQASDRPRLLVARDLEVVRPDGTRVLAGVDIDVHVGEILGVAGGNGSGKSALLRALAGFEQVAAGAVVVDGRDSTRRPPHETARAGVVLVPSATGVVAELTVAENLALASWGEAEHGPRAQLDDVLALFPVLADRVEARAGDLSTGQQKMLSMAMTMLGGARVLLIDDLGAGLSPVLLTEFHQVLERLRSTGVSIVVGDADADVLAPVADRILVLERGEVRDLETDALVPSRTGRRAAVRSMKPSGEARATSGPVLEVSGAVVTLGGVVALDDVSIEAQRGEILALVGPNGAGKTMLLDSVSGHVRLDAGMVCLAGRRIDDLGPGERARLGVLRRFHDVALSPALTVREALLLASEGPSGARLSTAWRAPARTELRQADRLLDLFDLSGWGDRLVSEIPAGARRVVDLACAMQRRPEVLLLDEPSAMLDTGEADFLVTVIRAVRDDTGCAVVLCEHDPKLVAALADSVVALDAGRVVAAGAPAPLPDPAGADDRKREALGASR